MNTRSDGTCIRIQNNNGTERVEIQTTIPNMVMNVRNNADINPYVNEHEILE